MSKVLSMSERLMLAEATIDLRRSADEFGAAHAVAVLALREWGDSNEGRAGASEDQVERLWEVYFSASAQRHSAYKQMMHQKGRWADEYLRLRPVSEVWARRRAANEIARVVSEWAPPRDTSWRGWT